MGRKKTTEEFIIEAKEVHGNKYDYSLVEYQGAHTKVIIVCPEHGQITIRPNSHITKKSGCPYCAGTAKGTTSTFIQKAQNIHGNKYDYSSAEYQGAHTKITIICPEHGIFKMEPVAHISQKQGCLPCGIIRNGNSRRKSTEQFISEATQVHGNNYDYSLVKYYKNNVKVKIQCSKHGMFEQMPDNHISKKQGCPTCWNERRPPGVGGYNNGFFDKHPDKKNASAILYIIEMCCGTDKFIKVGITQKSIKERYLRKRCGDKYLSKKVIQIIPMNLYTAWELEQKILKDLKDYQYFPNYVFEGRTECLKLNNIVHDHIKRIIESYD